MSGPALKSTVWLHGSPIFSLAYIDLVKGKPFEMHADLSGFRPSIAEYLEPDKKYTAVLRFERQTTPLGVEIRSLVGVDIASHKFIYIR